MTWWKRWRRSRLRWGCLACQIPSGTFTEKEYAAHQAGLHHGSLSATDIAEGETVTSYHNLDERTYAFDEPVVGPAWLLFGWEDDRGPVVGVYDPQTRLLLRTVRCTITEERS